MKLLIENLYDTGTAGGGAGAGSRGGRRGGARVDDSWEPSYFPLSSFLFGFGVSSGQFLKFHMHACTSISATADPVAILPEKRRKLNPAKLNLGQGQQKRSA